MSNGVSQQYLTRIYEQVEQVLKPLQLRCYIIGAFATQFWYDQAGNIPYRGTRDIDIVIGVPDYDYYDTVLDKLTATQLKEAHKRGRHTLVLPDATVIDLLPFHDWSLERSGYKVSATWGGPGELIGFAEVANKGLREYSVAGRVVAAASPAAIIGLKLIALDDRPENRLKDAADVGQIIRYYADLESDTIYEHHLDLFGVDEINWGTIGRQVLGRELRSVFASDQSLVNRLDRIMQDAVQEEVSWIRHLAQGFSSDSARAIEQLQDVLTGFRQNWSPPQVIAKDE